MRLILKIFYKLFLFIYFLSIIAGLPTFAQISVDDNNTMVVAQELFQKGKFSEAIRTYDSVIEKNNNYVPAYVQRGLAKSYAGDKANAIEDFTIALQKDSNSISALSNRGSEYRMMGKYKESISDFDRALKKDSLSVRSSNFFENRGWAKYDSGQIESSIKDFTNAIYRNTKSAHSYYMRGLAKHKLGKLDEACEDWLLAKVYGFKYVENEIERFCNNK
jgi:tetratricopeptide (TPR) repeat protein